MWWCSQCDGNLLSSDQCLTERSLPVLKLVSVALWRRTLSVHLWLCHTLVSNTVPLFCPGPTLSNSPKTTDVAVIIQFSTKGFITRYESIHQSCIKTIDFSRLSKQVMTVKTEMYFRFFWSSMQSLHAALLFLLLTMLNVFIGFCSFANAFCGWQDTFCLSLSLNGDICLHCIFIYEMMNRERQSCSSSMN